MNKTLWMIAALTGGMILGIAGCSSSTPAPPTTDDKTPTMTDDGDTTGDMTADDTMDGGGSDGMTDNTGDMTGTDDDMMSTDDTAIVPEIEEEAVLALLAEGVQDDTNNSDTPSTTTTEDPFFGEDPDLYGGVDLDQADDVNLGTILDSDRDALGRSSAQAVAPVIHGFLGGLTERTTTTNGLMRGRWFNASKEPGGVFRGEWIELSTAGEVRLGRFTAKYINDDGSFQGFLRGRWAVGPNGSGFFLGRWLDANDQDLGVLRGKWRDGENGGQFVGRWAGFDICSEAEDVDGDTQDTQSIDIVDVLNGADVTAPVIDMTTRSESQELSDVQVRGAIPCVTSGQPFGFLRGTHVAGTDTEPGTFTGRWVDGQGTITGTLRGVFGPADVVSSIAVEIEEPMDAAPQPQTITVSPDDYADGTKLTSTSEWVTLRTTVADGEIVGLFEITASEDGQGNAPSGSFVFGHSDIPFFNNDRRLRMDFAYPASMVQITFGGGTFSETEIGRLSAYNASNELIAEYVTQPLEAGQNEVMTINREDSDIAWAVAYIADGEGSFGRLDDLVFTLTEVPAEENIGVLPPPPGTVFDGLGVFVGEVQDGAGETTGYLRGHYGTSARGVHVFRGRYLDAEMNPRGFLKGRWTRPSEGTEGPMTGYWSGSEI